MLVQRSVLSLLVMLLLATPLRSLAADTASAEQVIQETSAEIMTTIESRKDELRQDSRQLYGLVEKIVLPHFDFDFISRLVLGPAWKEASPENRKRFSQAFQKLLVRTYSNALLEYSGEQIKWLEARSGDNPNRVIQRAEVKLASGQVVPMNYRMHKTDSGWKVYDITIDNISLVLNYRGTFAGEIRKNGLPSLIERLEAKNSAS